MTEDGHISHTPVPAPPLTEEEAARFLLRLADAVDQTSQVLEVATDLHRRLCTLHAALTEPVVDLERLMRDARAAAPNGLPPAA